MDNVFLGVDGGGTKTRFVLMGAEGQTLAETQLSTTYHPQVGVEGVNAILREGVASVLAQSGLHASDIRYAFFGLPAHGEDSRVDPILNAMPEGILGHDRYSCGNDMICGWAGSLGCHDGINIVAGTGSIGYGERQNKHARAGGWGEIFSDEGSSYWIAIQALNAFSRMSDGRQSKGPLHALLYRHFALERDLDICSRLMGTEAITRDRIAQLSLIVSEAAEAGDATALRIFSQAANELVAIVDVIRQRLGFRVGERVLVSYSGGAFSAGHWILVPFEAKLQSNWMDYVLQRPMHPPHTGAAMYAAKLAGIEIHPKCSRAA